MKARRMLAAPAVALAALGWAAGVAAADPDPAPEPAPPVEAVVPAPPVDPFTAASTQTKDNPMDAFAALLSGGPGGSSPAAALSQGVGLSGPPPVDLLAPTASLYPQNYRMPSGEEASPYVLQTGVPAGPFARVDAFKGVHALIHGGLGRMPGAELGQPLDGTAPPPGTNLPPGLEQFYVDPVLPPMPPAPAG